MCKLTTNNFLCYGDIIYNIKTSLTNMLNFFDDSKQNITDNLSNIINNLQCPNIIYGPTNNPLFDNSILDNYFEKNLN